LGSSALFVALISLFVPIVGVRSDAVLISLLGKQDKKAGETIDTVLTLPPVIACGITILLMIMVAMRVPLERNLGIGVFWVFAAVFTSLLAVFFYDYLAICQYHERLLHFSVVQLSVAISTLVLSGILIIVFLPNAAGRNIGYATPLIVAGLLTFRQLLLNYKPRLRITEHGLRYFLSISVPLIASTAASIMVGTVDRFVIASNYGRSAVGFYAFGVSLGLAVGAVNEGIYAAWVPAVVHHIDKKQPRSHLLQTIFVFFCGVCAFAGLYYLMLPAVINIVSPDGRYGQSLGVARATVIALVGKGTFHMLEAVLVFERRMPRLTGITNSTMAVLAPVGIYYFAKLQGPVGPQHAILLIYGVAAAFYGFLALKR
jgi:O-antigen/teichoic acid export membrane protein